MTSTSADQISKDFRESRRRYEAFTTSLESLLRNLTSAVEIEPFAYESRTKTVGSFDEKLQREEKAGKYTCLTDVTDLSGVRIICYLQEHCDLVCEMIESEFTVDQENSISKQDELDADKFGYLSTHYVVSLNEARSNLKEFQAFGGMKAEVQVRTLLQHTWAAIDWKFRYKQERESPKPLRRRLFRISALLEAADNEFSQVKAELDQLRTSYSESVSAGRLDISLNTESLASYLAQSETVNSILDVASQCGVRFRHGGASSEASISSLVLCAESLGLHTIHDLDVKLKQSTGIAERFFSHLQNSASDQISEGKFRPYDAALLRYLLLADAPSGKRQLILKDKPALAGVSRAIASFTKANT